MGVDHSPKGVKRRSKPRNGRSNAFSIRSVTSGACQRPQLARSVVPEPVPRVPGSDFDYREWLVLKYAQDWAFLKGPGPDGDYVADYESHYSVEQRDCFYKIMRMMRFTNSLGNTLSHGSSGSDSQADSAACAIQTKEYSRSKKSDKENSDHAVVVAPPPVIFGVVLIAGILLQRFFPLTIISESSALSKVLGQSLFVIAALIMFPTTVWMIKKKTALLPDRPVTTLLTDGIFRYSRNPLYFSLLLIFLGIAFYANSPWYLFVFPLFFLALDFGVIRREEAYLERKFGDEYVRYKQKVRRWI